MDGKLKFQATSNIPDETPITFTLKGKKYLAQCQAITNARTLTSDWFSDRGNPIKDGFYTKVEPRPDDAPKREFTFDEKGNIVVKNLSAFWLPDVKIVDEQGGTEYIVTGSYEGTETLDKKLHRIMEQNAADDELGITEDGE